MSNRNKNVGKADEVIMPSLSKVAIIIPSLNPDEKFIKTLDGILEKGFRHVIIVDDGSDLEHKKPFDYARDKDCVVLIHKENKGKGRALKTAFEYCLKSVECAGVVTVDGDGQHGIDDIYRCATVMVTSNKVVLGCRDFSEHQVPFKSKYGNNITKFAFKALCGIKISDTQTGLRAIPTRYLKQMLEMSGERFEYETNMLLEMKAQDIPWVEQKIETIYLDDNASSHFNPFKDSWKIYKIIFKYSFGRIFKYALSSGASAVIDIGIFYLMLLILDTKAVGGVWVETNIAAVTARVVSSVFNFLANKYLVFKSGSISSVVKYYTLCAIQLVASTFFVSWISSMLKPTDAWETVIKLVIDTLLFFVSYSVQKTWVFKEKHSDIRMNGHTASDKWEDFIERHRDGELSCIGEVAGADVSDKITELIGNNNKNIKGQQGEGMGTLLSTYVEYEKEDKT